VNRRVSLCGLATVSRLFGDQLDVYAALPLTATDQHPDVRFADDVWDLTHFVDWPRSQAATDFVWSKIANPSFRLAAKESALLLMLPSVAIEHGVVRRRKLPAAPWNLYHNRYSLWVRWFNWLDAHGVGSLGEVAQEHCDSWLETISTGSRNHAVAAIRVMADYGIALSTGGYGRSFRPWGESTALRVTGQAPNLPGENKTPVMPDEVFAPLLGISLVMLGAVAHDWLVARLELRSLKGRAGQFPGGWRGDNMVDRALESYLAALMSSGTPVPESKLSTSDSCLGVSLRLIALNIGLSDGDHLRTPRRMALIETTVRAVGVGRAAIHIPITPVVVGDRHVPWTDGMRPRDIYLLETPIRTAALIVVAGLTGMRTSELATITGSSARAEEVGPGLTRYRVEARILKGRPPGGDSDSWLTIRETIDAIRTMALVEESDETPLFPTVGFRDSYDAFVSIANPLAERLGMSPVPADYKVYLRQFRRKVSREMAFRNFGIIATMQQFKHASVITTEGYAGARGGAVSMLQKEIEQERPAVNANEITRIYGQFLDGEPMAGLGARALETAFKEARGAVAKGSGSVRNDDVIRYILKQRGSNLHTGPMSHCWFNDPSAARCLQGRQDKSKPLVGMCQPEKCANATIHPHHAVVWLGKLRAVEATMSDRRVPAGERERQKQTVLEYRRIVDKLAPAAIKAKARP
jgi:hypothetical protein